LLARSLDEVEQLRPLWESVSWDREDGDYEMFMLATRQRPDVERPYAALVVDGSRPLGAVAGRVLSRRLPAQIGYTRVYAPRVHLLQVVQGGAVASDPWAVTLLVTALRDALVRREADAVALPALPVESPLFSACARLGGALERDRFSPTWYRRTLVLPSSFEEFLASRSYETRRGIRKNANRLSASLGRDLRTEVVREPAQHDRLMCDVDRLTRKTYQRALGSGFTDTPEHRSWGAIQLERGWLRAYVLYRSEEPIAYWVGSLYRGALLLRWTGYDPEYARLRPGAYLLARLIEEACADPGVAVIDFGPGRSEYKRHFANSSHPERSLIVFAPTVRARRINAIRTAARAAAWAGRGTLDALGATDRVKSGWRRRLRVKAASS
jgi:hypothetical protein